MDPKRFDRLARALGGAKLDRRGVAGAVLGVGGLAAAYRLMFAQPACAGEGQSCTIMGGCCDGFVCHVSMMNPNFGACRAGDDILGTGWTFAGMTALPAVATEIARERRRKKGRNKKRNSNKRARATATPVPTSTPLPPATTVPQTPTPDPGDGLLTPTLEPTENPNATPPTADAVAIKLDLDCAIGDLSRPEVTKIRNTGQTEVKVTVMVGSTEFCINPELVIPINESRTILTGPGETYGAYMFMDNSSNLRVQVSYESASGVVGGYVVFRGYCDGDPTDRLETDTLRCRR